jgi:hypothetical protein
VAGAVAHEQVHDETTTDSEERRERRERHADREQRAEEDCGGAEDPCPAWERENDPEGRSTGAPLASPRDTLRGRRRRIGVPVAGGRGGTCLLATMDGHGRVISFVLRRAGQLGRRGRRGRADEWRGGTHRERRAVATEREVRVT